MWCFYLPTDGDGDRQHAASCLGRVHQMWCFYLPSDGDGDRQHAASCWCRVNYSLHLLTLKRDEREQTGSQQCQSKAV